MNIDLRRVNEKSKVVVFDIAGPFKDRNMLFDRAVVTERHGLSGCYLYEACLKAGIQLLTPDLFDQLPTKPSKVLYVKNSTGASREKEFLSRGAIPVALMGFEHPLYACVFYWSLPYRAMRSHHIFMPEGARPFVPKGPQFHSWISPQCYTNWPEIKQDFATRKYLMMINGNTVINRLKRLFVRVAQFVRPLPSLVDRELYVDRLEAIRFFSERKGFDLYGRGWDKPVPYKTGYYDGAVAKTWKGEVGDKLDALRQYRFSICFENCIFDGLVTEKIIDSMAAGCVPVYWGAPDITRYVPEDTFIDFQKFDTFEKLDEYLRAMDEATWNGYIDRINAFFKSSQYYEHFSEVKFAKDMIKIFNSYLV